MSYDPYGRTPEQVRRELVRDWLCVLALGLMLACAAAIGALVLMLVCA